MPRNGSGTASKAVVDFVTGNTISATDMNTLIDDIISMLTNSVSKDGQTVITGTLDFNGNRIILDVDADTSITADSDDQIDFEVGGSDVVRFNTVGVVSVPTAGITAGTTQTQGGATALTKGINEVSTCANSGDGVKLPTAVAGQKVTIINNGAEDLKIWPNTSDKIKGGSADAADPDTLRSGRSRTYVAIDAENWYLSVEDKKSFALGLTAGTTQTQGGATAMTASINEFSTVANTDDGGKLPSDTGIGERVMVVNNGANALKVWPATGDNINSGAANAADSETIAAGAYRIYTRQTATKWSYSVSTDAVNSFTASGAITAGDPVALLLDGKVKTISDSTTATSAGTEAVFESADTRSIAIAFDEANEKVVIAYGDWGNSTYGTAVVGTVSGTSISFGTPVVFHAGATQGTIGICFDSANEKVVIAYADSGASSHGKAIVGTVSGTSISFGSEATFEAAAVNYPLDLDFDTANQKVVIGYRDGGNSNRPTGIVGTVSGTSISFGTAVQIDASTATSGIAVVYDPPTGKTVIFHNESASLYYNIGTVSGTSISFTSPRGNAGVSDFSDNVEALYHSAAQKIVFTYKNTSNDLKYRVGTVSADSVSFGTLAVAITGTVITPEIAYDSTREKIVAVYSDGDDLNHGKVDVGTLSGTEITWEGATDFASADSDYPAATFDSSNSKIVVAFSDADNSANGTAAVITPTDFTAPLRTFAGLATETVADAASVDVTTLSGVNANQSSLTTGLDYYVKQDGTLTTIDPGGKRPVLSALSATEALIIASR